MPRYKHASIYIDGKKLGKATGGSYTPSSASEAQYNDDGYAGESEAPFMTEVTADTIEPIGSSGLDLTSTMLRRTYVNLAVATVENRIHQIDNMRVVRAETRWTNNNGVKTGSYTFRGGVPKIV